MTNPIASVVGANMKRLTIAVTLGLGAIACSAVPGTRQTSVTATALQNGAIPDFDMTLLAAMETAEPDFEAKPRQTNAGWTSDDVQMPAGGLTKEENCLATAVYFEARGEPLKGQKAVAEVVMTRAGSGLYPRSICGVVYQNSNHYLACQFTFTCDGVSHRTREKAAWSLAQRVAVAAMTNARNKRPLTNWATHYHASYVKPAWASKLVRTATIGTHIFYREPGFRSS